MRLVCVFELFYDAVEVELTSILHLLNVRTRLGLYCYPAHRRKALRDG